MKGALLAAATVALLSSPASAQVSGNELYEECKTAPNLCFGYIVGAADMYTWQMQHHRPICTDGLAWVQIRDVVVKHLEAHPETRHLPAAVLVARAMFEAFECPP